MREKKNLACAVNTSASPRQWPAASSKGKALLDVDVGKLLPQRQQVVHKDVPAEGEIKQLEVLAALQHAAHAREGDVARAKEVELAQPQRPLRDAQQAAVGRRADCRQNQLGQLRARL